MKLRAILASALLLTSCGTAEQQGEEGAGFFIHPRETVLLVGEMASMELRARENGAGLGGEERAVVWSSEDPEIVAVYGEGMVEGRAVGETRIRARLGDQAATAKVRVEAPLELEIVIDLHQRSSEGYLRLNDKWTLVEVGETLEVEASVLKRGRPGERPLSINSFEWTASDSTAVELRIPSIGGSGPGEVIEVRAIGPGTSVIRASSPWSSAEFEARVIRKARMLHVDVPSEMTVGERYRVVGEALDEEGEPIPERQIEWSSSEPTIVAVDGQEAVALEPGEAWIQVTSRVPNGRQFSEVRGVVVHP